MEKKAENVFNSADLKSPEVLWSFQYSQNLGGGGSGTPVAGHRISIQTTTRINKIAGCINTADQGGYGWGRIYPNTYFGTAYHHFSTCHGIGYTDAYLPAFAADNSFCAVDRKSVV